MAHPLLSVLATRPALVAEHVEAYAGLLGADVSRLWVATKRRALLDALALCGLFLAFALAGVSTMLWAVHPASAGGSFWLLIVVPVVPALLAIGCMVVRAPTDANGFARTRNQIEADLALLRETGTR